MSRKLTMLAEIYRVPINMVTYHRHGYDDNTVRFVLVDTLELSYPTLLTDMNNWSMSGLKINECDYRYEPLEMMLWVVGDVPDMIMFNLKYKNYIIIALDHKQMIKNIHAAKKTVVEITPINGGVKWADEVDYMNVLAHEADIENAYERYCKRGKP